MQLQQRFVQPVVMAALMASMMSGFVTWLNLGFRPDFLYLWAKAFATVWPLASVATFVAGPLAPKVTQAILRRINSPS